MHYQHKTELAAFALCLVFFLSVPLGHVLLAICQGRDLSMRGSSALGPEHAWLIPQRWCGDLAALPVCDIFLGLLLPGEGGD